MKAALVLHELSYNSFFHGIVYGEELDALGLQSALIASPGISGCKVVTPNILTYLGRDRCEFDLAIHFFYPTIRIESALNVLYFQQFYDWERHDLTAYLAEFDLVVTPAKYVAHGGVRYLPLAVDPATFYPDPSVTRVPSKTIFLGNRKMRDLETYETFLKPHLDSDLEIYGAGWEEPGFEVYRTSYKGMLKPHRTRALYSSAGLSLSIHNSDYVTRFGLATNRAFHSVLCGAPVLADPTPVLKELLPAGDGVVYTTGGSDSITARTRARSQHNEIVSRGTRRILDEHTWMHRVSCVRDWLRI